jgi:thiosulfate reductase cytochrome b subunit
MDLRSQLGFMLIFFGALMVFGGIAVMYADKIPYLGRLPGDITIHGKNWSFHFPIVTGLILSIVLTIILNLFFRR